MDNVEYDYVRESGLEFNPETMRLEEPARYSLKKGNSKERKAVEYIEPSEIKNKIGKALSTLLS